MHKQTKKFTLATISALSLLGTGVITANQVSASENTSTEKQIEATITKVEIDYFGLSFEGKLSEPLPHGGDNAAKGNVTLIDKATGKIVYQSHDAVIFSGLTKDVSDQFLQPLFYSNQFKGDIFVSEQFPDGTYILEMSGEAGSPYGDLTDTRKRVFKVRKDVTIGNPSTNSNTNTTTQSGSNSNISGSWLQSGSRWWYKHADGSYTTNGWEGQEWEATFTYEGNKLTVQKAQEQKNIYTYTGKNVVKMEREPTLGTTTEVEYDTTVVNDLNNPYVYLTNIAQLFTRHGLDLYPGNENDPFIKGSQNVYNKFMFYTYTIDKNGQKPTKITKKDNAGNPIIIKTYTYY